MRVKAKGNTKTDPKLSKSERTRARIIHAAIDIIATKGIERATTREIAKKAKIANGLVSRYFPEIDRIFDDVIQAIAEEAYRSIEHPPESSSGHDKILHMCQANFEFFSAHPRYLKCFLLFYYYCSIRVNLRQMNNVLTARAEQRCREYLKQHFSETHRNVNEQTLDGYAALIHNHLMSAILKLLIVDRTDNTRLTPNVDLYQNRFLSTLSHLINSGLN